jgi:uncharacterized membrane protein
MRSLAAIAGHPIHPMLVVVPIGAVVGALVLDIAPVATDTGCGPRARKRCSSSPSCRWSRPRSPGSSISRASRKRDATARLGAAHRNVAVLTPLLVADVAVRLDDPVDGLRPEGIVLTSVAALTLVVTGLAGGELAYRHGIGLPARRDGLGLPGVADASRVDATAEASRPQVRGSEQEPHVETDRELAHQATRLTSRRGAGCRRGDRLLDDDHAAATRRRGRRRA